MRSTKDIERLVRRAGLRSRCEVSNAVLDDLCKEFASGTKDAVAATWARSRMAKATIAAAVIGVVGLIVIAYSPHQTQLQPPGSVSLSAGDMLTVGHLNAACRHGGLGEVERQCDRAADLLQARPEKVSADELIRELKGT